MERRILRAAPGMVLTDGSSYGKVIFLADGADASVFHEITDAAYEAVMEAQMLHEV